MAMMWVPLCYGMPSYVTCCSMLPPYLTGRRCVNVSITCYALTRRGLHAVLFDVGRRGAGEREKAGGMTMGCPRRSDVAHLTVN